MHPSQIPARARLTAAKRCTSHRLLTSQEGIAGVVSEPWRFHCPGNLAVWLDRAMKSCSKDPGHVHGWRGWAFSPNGPLHWKCQHREGPNHPSLRQMVITSFFQIWGHVYWKLLRKRKRGYRTPLKENKPKINEDIERTCWRRKKYIWKKKYLMHSKSIMNPHLPDCRVNRTG